MQISQIYLSQIAVKCPKCGSKFNSKQVPVWLDLGLRNSELRQDLAGKAPPMEAHAICTCPACGNSNWMKDFPVTNEEAVLNQANIAAHLQYRQAALESENKSRDFYNAGTLYLYAAWCADDNKAHPQAREYRRNAIIAFTKALMDVSCPVNERPVVEYLIGELYRRTGDFAAAQTHLQEVLPRLPGKLAYMARKIIKLAADGNPNPVAFETSIS